MINPSLFKFKHSNQVREPFCEVPLIKAEILQVNSSLYM